MNEIKKLCRRTGLTQQEFSAEYKIPLKTLQNWESLKGRGESRTCPSYIVMLLKRAVEEDFPEDTFIYIDKMMKEGTLQKSKAHIKALKDGLRKIEDSDLGDYVIDVILYGSFARGEADRTSDVDLLIVLSEKLKEVPKYNSMIRRLKGNISPSDIREPEVDLHVAFGNTWKLSGEAYHVNIQEEGIRVWH